MDARISWVALSTQAQASITHVALEATPTDASISWVSLEYEQQADAKITWLDVERVVVAADAEITWVGLEPVGADVEVTWVSLEPTATDAKITWLELGATPADVKVTWLELGAAPTEAPPTPAPQDYAGNSPGWAVALRSGSGGDSSAYTAHQVKQRIQAVVIDGTSYDPFADNLIEILEASARQTTASPTATLARTFTVVTPEASIEVPLFRPMLDSMPNFKTAIAQDFEAYTQLAKIEIEDEQRRIILLLSDFSFA